MIVLKHPTYISVQDGKQKKEPSKAKLKGNHVLQSYIQCNLEVNCTTIYLVGAFSQTLVIAFLITCLSLGITNEID